MSATTPSFLDPPLAVQLRQYGPYRVSHRVLQGPARCGTGVVHMHAKLPPVHVAVRMGLWLSVLGYTQVAWLIAATCEPLTSEHQTS
jgi:hypothetical protein